MQESKLYIGYYNNKTYRCPTVLRVLLNNGLYYIGLFEFCVKRLEHTYDKPTLLKRALKASNVNFIKI